MEAAVDGRWTRVRTLGRGASGAVVTVGSDRPIGGTPAFMAPEVARGEEQEPAADVWALGCTVIEMATGRAPWSDMEDILSAVRRIGYTDAVPEVPEWLSAEAKDFLARCFARNPRERWTSSQLLEHPFLASAGCSVKTGEAAPQWVSPKSTLDAAFWESDTDDEEDDMPASPAERIKALACPCSALPDWDSDEGWIQVLNESSEACDTAVAKVEAEGKGRVLIEALETINESSGGDAECVDPECTVRLITVASIGQQEVFCLGLINDPLVFSVNKSELTKSLFPQIVSF
uniref:Protein kinase domain-containing protein n=1 Tax=Oryza barthii TaxID=65489 RepID=A0A0D3ESX2_9ORYZ